MKQYELTNSAILRVLEIPRSVIYYKNKRGSEFKNQLIDELIDKYHMQRSLSHKGGKMTDANIVYNTSLKNCTKKG